METGNKNATSLSNSEEENNPIYPITNTSDLTYYEHRDNDGGLEIDLVFLREKGVPLKYLSITVQGFDLDVNPPSPNSATITISTQEAFDKFKNFIAQLKWE